MVRQPGHRPPGQLTDLSVVVAQGDADHVIPRELLDRTWDYLLTQSGAETQAHRDPGGHGITGATLQHLAGWLQTRITPFAVRP